MSAPAKVWGVLKGWKTVTLGILVAVLSLLDALQAIDLSIFISPAYRSYFGVGLGLVIILLRWVTTTPIFQSQ